MKSVSPLSRSAVFFRSCAFIALFAWESSRAAGYSLGGYLEELPFVSFPPENRLNTGVNNLLQFRLNTQWYPCSSLTLEASGRVLWYGGKEFKNAGTIASQLSSDPGYLDLAWAQGRDGTPLVLFENIDRLSVELTKGKFSATAGRQRINWGTNLVWNPNDWFNAFNYLDFAYPEHPGSDALRLQYYPSETSVGEIAVTAGRIQEDRTFAALYKFNRWAYDWQFQAGLSGNDLAAGFSWSGSIKGAGFRGESAWYYPVLGKTESSSPTLVASISGDYTFANSLYLHAAALYNGFGAPDSATVPLATTSRITAKSLIPKRYALFGETAYQFTPLVRLDFSASVGPTDGSIYIAPSIAVSLLDNLDLFVLGQVFLGSPGDLYGVATDIVVMSAKWSF